MTKVKEKLHKLLQEINSIGCSIPLLYVNLDFIEKMELEANSDPVFKRALTDIDKLADKSLINMKDYSSLVEIKNTYSEVYILSKLRSFLHIDKIKEKNSKSPDFEVTFRGNKIFIEMKSLNMRGGTLKHRNIMNESLDCKISLDEQIHNGKNIAFAEQVIQPYDPLNKEYNSRSVRCVAESLIEKIDQNFDKEQYTLGDTVLLLDLSCQLPLISSPLQAIQEQYLDSISKSYVSGELWNVAFAKIGDKILSPPEFEGARPAEEELQKEGVLIAHPEIKGIIYHTNNKFYSVAGISEDNLIVLNLLKYISCQYSFRQ